MCREPFAVKKARLTAIFSAEKRSLPACLRLTGRQRRMAQVAEKVEVQEALPPAGVLGAEPLSLMPQHFPREPAKRCFQAMASNQGLFNSLSLAAQGSTYTPPVSE